MSQRKRQKENTKTKQQQKIPTKTKTKQKKTPLKDPHNKFLLLRTNNLHFK